MSRQELFHRVRERLSILVMWVHYLRGHFYSSQGFAADRFHFCSSLSPLLPDLPWVFEPNSDEIQELLDGKGAALGFAWKWHEDPAVWHTAPDTQREWPRSFFAAIPYRSGNPHGDIRVVWEPSRLQHLVALALCAKLSPPEEAAQFVALLEKQLWSWVEANPPFTGVHYISAMECALRLIAVCHALDLVRERLQQNARVWPAMLKLVHSHASFIERRLSLHSSCGNHTIAECAGLVYAGALFPEFNGAQRWKALGLKFLTRESERQILSDGGGIEQAFWYLLFILDLCGLVRKLLEHHAETPPTALKDATRRGKAFLNAVASGPSSLPDMGDRDDGFALSPHLNLSWEHSESPERLVHFPETGCTLIYTRGQVRANLLFDHGPLGMPPLYGHGHADALSVVLYMANGAILIDPGTYTYTGDPTWRAYFRGTRAHNTVGVDGLDQAKQVSAFQWSNPYRCELYRCDESDDGRIRLLGFHDGYTPIGVTHWRGVVFLPDDVFLVYDRLTGRGSHRLELNWHCGPVPARKGLCYEMDHFGHRVLIEISGGDTSPYCGALGSRLGWRSPKYGVREETTVLQTVYDGPLPHEFITLIGIGSQSFEDYPVKDELALLRTWVDEAETN